MPIPKALLGTTGLLLLVPPLLSQREQARSEGKVLDLSPVSMAGGRPVAITPVLAGGMAFVSTTLRIHAFDTASGELAWSSEPPAGWDALEPTAREGLWAGIDHAGLLVAPAASARVVVAALQVPLARAASEEWHGLRIRAAFPERRLFAFDLASGRPLWNHAPSPDRDRSSGPFPQRMHVCASPLVLGDRVLVPCTSDGSSVDYHVACYALESGALLWTTFVTRGQVERDLFGNGVSEFAAAPLAASPDGRRVLAQTGLGSVAALAFHDGAVLWAIDYDPIPLPKARSYQAVPRALTWRTAPPLVADGSVWATPRDSTRLLALDLESGTLLASVPAAELQALAPAEAKLALDHLAGIAGELVLLGGRGIAAFEREGGLDQPGAWRVRWAHPGERLVVRARLRGDELIVPDGSGLACLDPVTGAERARHPLRDLLGLAVTDSELIGVDRRGLVIGSR